jgi:hypothetical protein
MRFEEINVNNEEENESNTGNQTGEQNEGGQKENSGTEGDEGEDDGEPELFKSLEELADKTKRFIDSQIEQVDKTIVAKVASLGLLVLFGLRKNNPIGSLMVLTAAGIIAKDIFESGLGSEEEEDTGEEEIA